MARGSFLPKGQLMGNPVRVKSGKKEETPQHKEGFCLFPFSDFLDSANWGPEILALMPALVDGQVEKLSNPDPQKGWAFRECFTSCPFHRKID